MKTCVEAGCDRPQFGGGFCKYHQFRRYMKNGDLFKPKKRKKTPPKESKKRKEEHKYYKQLCQELWDELVAEGKNYCFFCGKKMEKREDFHHIRGRVRDNYLNREYIVPAHNDCHVWKYHQASIEQLMREPWYEEFMNRLREIDSQSYYKERNKLTKAELEFKEAENED